MKPLFLIITDIDSTFEQYFKHDFSYEGEQFDEFVDFMRHFEETFHCEVKIHFVSGVGRSEIKEKLKYFKEEHATSIYPKIGESVVENGYVVNENGQVIDRCDTDCSAYSKADGVNYILDEYRGFDVRGACFMGDAKEDIPGFMMIKAVKYPLGTYAICTRSQRDYEKVINYVDFYSTKPRIIGCCECLKKMEANISKKIDAQK